MADRLAARSQRRLSVWAATEPLPAPLPPPPRARAADQPVPVPIQVELHPPHTVPPESHLTSREADAAPPQTQTIEPAPERSLMSPSVLISLVISALLLGGLMWGHSSSGGKRTVSSIILGALIESEAPDAELPYITVMPMTPTNGDIPMAQRASPLDPRKTERVRLSDLKMIETPAASMPEETQRR